MAAGFILPTSTGEDQQSTALTVQNDAHDELGNILRKYKLYDGLYDILNANSIDLEMLRNDLDPSDVDQFCADIGISGKQKVQFRKLLRMIGSNHNIKPKLENNKQDQSKDNKIEQKVEDSDINPVSKMTAIIIGDSSVGKSCLMHRYISKSFDEMSPTMGFAGSQEIEILNDKIVRVYMIDTAGSDNLHVGTCTAWYRKVHIILVCYDLAAKNPFSNLSKWRRRIEEYAADDVSVILVGTKQDLATTYNDRYAKNKIAAETIIRTEEWKRFNAIHLVCSAKTGYNVATIFSTAVSIVAPWERKDSDNLAIDIRQTVQHNTSRKCC